jgi:hypothetical protein
MSLKLLVYALERASLEYATTRSPYALQRALELIDSLRDSLNDIEELLLETPAQQQEKEA